jgi:hypothetical protein
VKWNAQFIGIFQSVTRVKEFHRPVAILKMHMGAGTLAQRQTYTGSRFEANLDKKLARPHLNQQSSHGGGHTLSQLLGGIGRRVMVQGFSQAKTRDPTWINWSKKGLGCGLSGEQLPSKLQSCAKKKKKKKIKTPGLEGRMCVTTHCTLTCLSSCRFEYSVLIVH